MSKATYFTPGTRYKSVFGPGTLLRQRLDDIVEGWGDPAPGTSGSEELEKLIAALAAGKPDPYAWVGDKGGKRRTRRPAKDYPVVESVAAALIDLF